MIIYKITNNINGKCYIGQSQHTFNRRYEKKGFGAERVLACYEFSKQKGEHYNIHLYRSMKKYGVENFTVEILEQCKTVAKLNSREKYYIKLYNSADPDFGYNYQLGGGSRQYTTKMKKYKQEQKRLDEITQYSFFFELYGSLTITCDVDFNILHCINMTDRLIYVLLSALHCNGVHTVDMNHLCGFIPKGGGKLEGRVTNSLNSLKEKNIIDFLVKDDIVSFNVLINGQTTITLQTLYHIDLVENLAQYGRYLKKETVLITCKECGRLHCVLKNACNTKYCKKCKAEVNKKKSREYNKKRRQKNNHPQS